MILLLIQVVEKLMLGKQKLLILEMLQDLIIFGREQMSVVKNYRLVENDLAFRL